MTRHELTTRIKQYAHELGFCSVGIARAGRLEEESKRLQEWLDRGMHGTMRWMETTFDKRTDPRTILPDAQSVISVALNYYTKDRQPPQGKVSRYAWGDDYHDIVHDLLDQLFAFIQSIEQSAEGKVYVDTGPVMDKVWAQRAGIGWEGKHTNVITQDHGSWVFLGEIIVNVELNYDEPATDHCGTCTLCIEACPTQAIVEPYVVDSTKCISYLTIEHKGEIAQELGNEFEGWLYGCDICQDVCPWNEKFSSVTALREFEPRPVNISPDPQKILEMSQEEFSKAYARSPMKRTKLSGLKRNAQVLLSTSNHS